MKYIKYIKYRCVFLYALVFLGCSFSADLVKPYQKKEYWTRTNLHHDGSEIHWKNYLSMTLLPIGTPVRLLDIYPGYLKVEDMKGNEYEMMFPGEAFDNAEKAISSYLTSQNPLNRLKYFTKAIRQSIRSSIPLPSMTKEQVLMAIGYPPLAFENYIYLDLNIWEYLEKKQEDEYIRKKVLRFKSSLSSNTLVSVKTSQKALYKMKDYNNLDPTEMENIIRKRLEEVDKSLVQPAKRMTPLSR